MGRTYRHNADDFYNNRKTKVKKVQTAKQKYKDFSQVRVSKEPVFEYEVDKMEYFEDR